MGLARIINCLSPVNPEAGRMPEHDSSLDHVLKVAGLLEAGIAALLYFNSEVDIKHIVTAGAAAVLLYLGGAVKDYLCLRREDICAEIEKIDNELTEIFGKPGTYL